MLDIMEAMETEDNSDDMEEHLGLMDVYQLYVQGKLSIVKLSKSVSHEVWDSRCHFWSSQLFSSDSIETRVSLLCFVIRWSFAPIQPLRPCFDCFLNELQNDANDWSQGFAMVKRKSTLDKDTINACFQYSIQCWVHSMHSEDGKSAFQHQDEVLQSRKNESSVQEKNKENDKNLLNELLQVWLSVFDLDQLTEILRSLILRRDSINRTRLLLLFDIILSLEDEARDALFPLCNKTVEEALMNDDFELFFNALLMSRQCLVDEQSTPSDFVRSYSQWLNELIDPEPKIIANLVKALTRLLPFDGVTALRTHVLRTPKAVSGHYKAIWNEYRDIAKTRIKDWNDTKASKAMVGTKSNCDLASQDLAEADEDVDRALAAFVQSNRVPNVVMETSMFRKHYFKSCFVPCLLKRAQKNKEAALFVQELRAKGKISNSDLSSHANKGTRSEPDL